MIEVIELMRGILLKSIILTVISMIITIKWWKMNNTKSDNWNKKREIGMIRITRLIRIIRMLIISRIIFVITGIYKHIRRKTRMTRIVIIRIILSEQW